MSEDKVTIKTKYYYDLLKKEDLLTELEEWLKAIMENAILKWGDNCAREFDLGCLDIQMAMKNYGDVLNKIQELKEKYKNE